MVKYGMLLLSISWMFIFLSLATEPVDQCRILNL